MKDLFAQKLANYGIDFTDAMNRMDDNVDLYERLAMKYLKDTNLIDFLAAMEVKDYDCAYESMHSLKGVSGNLSFTTLYRMASVICEELREGEPQDVPELIPALKEEHEKIIEGLLKWQTGNL
jgi:HPt (histidine-containing phosphotransfer) domain-containing protein